MIRYVLAVVLTVSLFALGMPAVDYAGTRNTERQVETSIGDLDRAAASLTNNEEQPPDGHPSPQRIVTVSLPRASMTTAPVTYFEIERISDTVTRVSYSIDGRATQQTVIDAPIVAETATANRSLELGGGGEIQLWLRLEADETGTPVLVVGQL